MSGSTSVAPRRRATSAIHAAFPEAVDLLRAVNAFWGRNGFVRWERSPRTCSAACPSCRSKALRREHVALGFPLVIEADDAGRYRFVALCHCPESAIVAALGDSVAWSDEEIAA